MRKHKTLKFTLLYTWRHSCINLYLGKFHKMADKRSISKLIFHDLPTLLPLNVQKKRIMCSLTIYKRFKFVPNVL